ERTSLERFKNTAQEALLTTQNDKNRYCSTYKRRARIKKSSEIRLCVDYCILDSIIIVDCFPMVIQRELIVGVSQIKLISAIDLTCEYWRLSLVEDSRLLTAFAAHIGTYGLRNTPAAFPHFIHQLFADFDYTIDSGKLAPD